MCVDDSPDLTDMMTWAIRQEPDLEDAGAMGSAEGIVEEVIRRRVDIVILDLTMPGPDPLGAISALADGAPLCRVIAFSGHDDPETREAARIAGAWELVSKHGEPNDVMQAIRRVAGQAVLRE